MDESYIDSRLSRNYARSRVGTRAFGKVSGKRGTRYSIVAGLLNNKIIAPCTVEGSCNTEVFKKWIKEVLAESIGEGYTLILDNVAFHKSIEVINTLKKCNINFIFLPPYSPDLNPIEHAWSWIKSRIKKLLSFSEIKLGDALVNILSSD